MKIANNLNVVVSFLANEKLIIILKKKWRNYFFVASGIEFKKI